MKTAIVHDWLVTYAGAEKVLEQILKVFPEADLFCMVDTLATEKRDFLLNKKSQQSFISKLPFAGKKYKLYLPLMPLAVEQFDLSEYDIVISSSHAVAKGVITGPDQFHVCMCYSPIRYAWDLQHQYLKESNLSKGPLSWLARYQLHKIRLWDLRTTNSVDKFIAISDFIKKRIYKVYRRDADVIYPPVYTEDFQPMDTGTSDYYVTASRLVPYKRIDLIVKTFAEKLPDKKLVVIGDGPDMGKLQKLASTNIEILGHQPFNILKKHLSTAKAFIFASKEDFGIAPLEAQAMGTPVIAFNGGGAVETIRGLDHDKPTGLFFNEQTEDSLSQAIMEFEACEGELKADSCIENAHRFNSERFRSEFREYVLTEYDNWQKCESVGDSDL